METTGCTSFSSRFTLPEERHFRAGALSLGPSSQGGKDRESEVKEAARGFETILLRMAVQEMKKTLQEGSFISSGPGAGVYEDFIEDLLAREISRCGGIGLGERLFHYLQGKERGGGEPGAYPAFEGGNQKVPKESGIKTYIQEDSLIPLLYG